MQDLYAQPEVAQHEKQQKPCGRRMTQDWVIQYDKMIVLMSKLDLYHASSLVVCTVVPLDPAVHACGMH